MANYFLLKVEIDFSGYHLFSMKKTSNEDEIVKALFNYFVDQDSMYFDSVSKKVVEKHGYCSIIFILNFDFLSFF